MPISAPVAVALGLSAFALVRAASKKKAVASAAASTQHQVLDVLIGPAADPCLGAAYTNIAQPLHAEIYANIKEPSKALYGARPVFFMPSITQGEAFLRIAKYRVDQPAVDPVGLVAAELAPNCNWKAPVEAWTPAMLSWWASLEKIDQIAEADIGTSQTQRYHAWDTVMLLRNTKTIRLIAKKTAGGSWVSEPVSFELPAGTGDVSLSADVSPANGGKLETLGIHDQMLLDGKGGASLAPVVELLPSTNMAGVVIFRLTATRANGLSTTGTLEIEAK